MSLRDFFIALMVALLWGFNFISMKVGNEELPPALFVTLRALFSVFPLIFFIPKPPISWTMLFLLGATIGIFKFLFISIGIECGICGSMISIVLQSQSFFTVLFGCLVLSEKPRMYQIFGMLVAFSGISLIGYDQMCIGTFAGILFVLAAAISWAISNILIKKASENNRVGMVPLMVWMSLIPPLPLFGLSVYQTSIQDIFQILTNASLLTYATVLYSSLMSGVFGYALWGHLLQKYPTPVVAPFSMLVPIAASIFCVLIFDEKYTKIMMISTSLVLLGLFINQFSPYFIRTKH